MTEWSISEAVSPPRLSKDHLSLLIAVVGPTGSGKSALALTLAERFAGEIVNCDSVQVYKGLDIGSAKTPVNCRRGIPHHLIDVVPPDHDLTAGEYGRLGRRALSEIRERGRLPVVAGGTGFYLRALLDGLSPAPERDESIRERLRGVAESRPAALHRFLRRYDPFSASRIHAHDRQKLIRAIEMTIASGHPASSVQSKAREPLTGFSILRLCLSPDRETLRDSIHHRTAQMFENGILEEVRALLDAGYSASSKALQSIGYKQALDVLFGRSSVKNSVEECQLRTRQYAKRQMTWFRKEQEMIWLRGFGTDRTIQQGAISVVERHLLFVSGRT